MTPEIQNEQPPTRDPAVDFSKWLTAVELAYREGYKDGYRNGEDGHARYEWGGGSKHPNVVRRDEDDGWRDSEAKAANEKGQR